MLSQASLRRQESRLERAFFRDRRKVLQIKKDKRNCEEVLWHRRDRDAPREKISTRPRERPSESERSRGCRKRRGGRWASRSGESGEKKTPPLAL